MNPKRAPNAMCLPCMSRPRFSAGERADHERRRKAPDHEQPRSDQARLRAERRPDDPVPRGAAAGRARAVADQKSSEKEHRDFDERVGADQRVELAEREARMTAAENGREGSA